MGKRIFIISKTSTKKSDGSVIQSKGAKLSVEYFVGCRPSFLQRFLISQVAW